MRNSQITNQTCGITSSNSLLSTADRRSFLKKSGGAILGTTVVWKLNTGNHAYASAAVSGTDRSRVIKCIAWPESNSNSQHGYFNDILYYTSVTISGAAEGERKSTFTLEIDGYGRKDGGDTATEKIMIKLVVNGNNVQAIPLSGDGEARNGNMTVLMEIRPMVHSKVILIEDTYALTKGVIGWSQEAGWNTQLEFGPTTKIRGTVAIGCAFTIVEVDSEGNEYS